jgi:hypothetical protein
MPESRISNLEKKKKPSPHIRDESRLVTPAVPPWFPIVGHLGLENSTQYFSDQWSSDLGGVADR